MIKSYVKDFLIISMANIQLGTLPNATIGTFLAAGNLNNLKNFMIIGYILLYFTLITFACNINCLYDLNVDKKYKKHRSDAVERFGILNIKKLILIEMIIAFTLIIYLYQMGATSTAILSFAGMSLCIIYSVPPFRLKARGILSPIPVFIGLYTLPLISGWFIFNSSLEIYFIVFVIGYALMNEGFTLVNTCEDYREDEEEGIRTWAHILGLKKTLTIAFIFTIGGFLSVAALTFHIFFHNLIFSYKGLIAFFLLGISTFTISQSCLNVYKVGISKDLETSSKIYARKMPKWFIVTRYPLLVVVLFQLL